MRTEFVIALAIIVGASSYFVARATTDTPLIQAATPEHPTVRHKPAEENLLPGKRIQSLPVPARGSENASVVIVEASDFQCPYSRRMKLVLDRIVSEFPSDVRHEYRHFPLGFHHQAKPAAIASMAAHRQGRFWEMRDRLYSDPSLLTRTQYIAWAKELGMDVEQFTKDLDDPALSAQVDNDTRAGKILGVKGTPTFLINGRPTTISPGHAYAELRTAVRHALDRTRKRMDKGMTAGEAHLTGVLLNAPNADTYFKEMLISPSLILEQGPPQVEWHPQPQGE
jgi:predicted DsbA family dithiol-disulfide isomerase